MCFFSSGTLDIYEFDLRLRTMQWVKKKTYPRMKSLRKMSENIHLYISGNNWFPDW